MDEPAAAADAPACSTVESLQRWFPDIPDAAWPRLQAWAGLMREWNTRINLVSRKDIAFLESRHLAPCLAVTRKLKLMPGARLLDLGTGGGLPGLPLAICYPAAHFTLLDSINKKTRVVADIAATLGLDNVEVECRRAENYHPCFDFVLGRAVARLDVFLPLARRNLAPGSKHSLANGVLYWKGGDFAEELKTAGIRRAECFAIHDLFPDPHQLGKAIIHINARDIAKTRVSSRERPRPATP